MPLTFTSADLPPLCYAFGLFSIAKVNSCFPHLFQVNQEEALRGVSLEALSHIMQPPSQSTSSALGMLSDAFNLSSMQLYHSASSLQPFNNMPVKCGSSGLESTPQSSGKQDSVNHSVVCDICKENFTDATKMLNHRRAVHNEQV